MEVTVVRIDFPVCDSSIEVLEFEFCLTPVPLVDGSCFAEVCYHVTVVFPPISAEKVDIGRFCAPRQKNANNTRSNILLQKKVGAIDKRNEHVISRCETGGFYRSWA